jgi:outer membrane protein insertion porin family
MMCVATSGWAAPAPSGGDDDRVDSSLIGKAIGAVEVRGARRIEKDAVSAKLASKPGELLTRVSIREDIRSAFGMGFFDDIEVLAEGMEGGRVRLIIEVRERPVISKVDFEGNERISASDLQEVIKVKEWSILDFNKVKEDVALVQKHYEEKGFYLAKVSFDVQAVKGKKDEVTLTYKVNDYDKVQIKRITFLNNRRFSDEQLRAVLQETREGGVFSFMSGSGNFKESAFRNDLQRLTLWYLDHGYVKFRYENPVVTVSDDKRWLFVSIYVDEGEQYQMGDVAFSGDILFPKDELKSEVTMAEGETFSISKRNADIQRLTEKYQDLGYAFVNVIPKMEVRDETKIVDIDYVFEKGSLVYFGEINVVGNSKTYDKVIRRELRVREGELYNGTRLRVSRENVERLGYFAPGEVIFNTITPKGKNDVLNVEISVKERSTGTITLGAGYGSVQGFFFTTQVSEINMLGRGQTVSLSAQLAKDSRSRSFNFGFTDPYAFDTKWSLGFDLFFVNNFIPEKYETRKLGFDVRLGYLLAEYTSVFVTYKNEGLKILNASVLNDPQDIEADNGVLSSVVFSVVRDKRNNRFETSGGHYASASLETAGLGGDKRFVKWVVNGRYYQRIVSDLVFRTNFEYGQITELGGDLIPPSEKFFLGGPNNLRGYRLFSIGPSRQRPATAEPGETDTVAEPRGGTAELLAMFELEYPLIREAGLKFVTFYDVGNAFQRFPSMDRFTLRSDAGLGIRWFSPIGPLRFEWGFPFRQKPGEESSQFVFFIGPPF